jgi:hypothetical protein
MKNQSNIPSDYLKGFNQGYQFAQEIPEFPMKDLQQLPEKLQNKPRIQGIMDGMRQYHHERYMAKLKTKAPKPSLDKTPNKGMRYN